jgi:hypothetical protein
MTAVSDAPWYFHAQLLVLTPLAMVPLAVNGDDVDRAVLLVVVVFDGRGDLGSRVAWLNSSRMTL